MKSVFYKNFEELCESHHMTCRATLIKLGINPSTITNWRNGSQPTVKTLGKIAEYFNVSINTLIGMTEEGITDYHLSPVSEDIEKVIKGFRKATDTDRQIVLLVLNKYLDEED